MFEFYLMKKPSFIYIPDKNVTYNRYHKTNFLLYNNAIVCDSQEDLYDNISNFIDSNCEITQD